MAAEGDGDPTSEWQVVSKRKKGGKSKQKQAEVPGTPPNESLTKTESCKEDLFTGSPSMRSIRSGSTKDTEAAVDEPVSLPDSPILVSSWSETSTDVPTTGLDESLLTEESCSLQASSSGASLEATATIDACDKVPELRSSKASKTVPPKVKPDAKGAVAAKPHLSDSLSNAIRRCEEGKGARQSGVPAQKIGSSGAARTAPPKEQAQTNCKKEPSSMVAACVSRPGGQCKAVGQQVVKSCRGNGNIADSARISDSVKVQGTSEKKATSVAKHHTKKHAAPSPPKEDLEPLGTTWVHNGRRDEAAEWRLLVFQPLWSCKTPDVPHIPVSVQAVDAGARLVIKQTFLNLEPTFDSHPRRARSLDPRLRGKKLWTQ